MKRLRTPLAAAGATVSRLLLAGLIALPAAGVLAQATAPTAQPTATTPATTIATPASKEANGRRGHTGMDRHNPAQTQERIATRQAELKDKLKITAAQEPVWSTYTAAMTPQAGTIQNRQAWHAQHEDMQKLPTPERIDKMRALRTQHMAEMTQTMEQRGDATKAFYAALTPEQQKTFDAEASQRGGRQVGDHHGGKHRNS